MYSRACNPVVIATALLVAACGDKTDAAASCEIPLSTSRFTVSAALPDGTSDRCESLPLDAGRPPTAHRTISGVVRSVTPTTTARYAVTIDTCVDDACGSQNAVFDIASTQAFTLPVGAFVEAEYWIVEWFACSYFVRFSNLPEWNGHKNPVSDTSKIYFLVSDGFINPNPQMASVGVTVALLPLGCLSDGSRGCGAPVPMDTYVFQFSHGGSDLTLPMGQSMAFTVNGQSVRVTNLRSYQSEACDDYWNWAFVFQDQ